MLNKNRTKQKTRFGIREVMEKTERDYIIQSLSSVNWKMSKAAEILCMDRSTLFRKMKKYGIEKGGDTITNRDEKKKKEDMRL